MRSTNERDPLLTNNGGTHSVSLPTGLNVANSNQEFIHGRSRLTCDNFHRIDDSKKSFWQKRGVSLIICFTIISLVFGIAIIFKSDFANILGYKDSQSQILYQRYEQDWSTLEHIEKRYIPNDWHFHKTCDESHKFDLTFAVKLTNTEKLTDELLKTSLPDSEDYGKHWSASKMHDFFAPEKESLNEMHSWLQYHGISKEDISYLTPNGDYLRVNVNCKQANKMLNTEFGFWNNKGDRKFAINSNHLRVKNGYSVPKTIEPHLDFISPTLRFPPRHHTNKVEFVKSVNNKDRFNSNARESISEDTKSSYVTPSKLTQMYHVSYTNDSNSNNSQAIASFLDEWFTYADYYLFQTYFDITRTQLKREPSNQPDGYGDEAELDVQYITSTGRGIETWAFDVEDDLYFITLLQRLADTDDPPFVVSISYGGDEQSNGWGYCNRANIEFGKVSLLGVTFFVSSGDEGAAGEDGCDDYNEFAPSFPATSQYVVAVGGTTGGKVQQDIEDSTEEAAWTDSGGGFSTYFSRMSFQDNAVESYFNESSDNLPNSTWYNSTGRAYPDISALSVYYIICVEKTLWSVSGTSCSSPAVAGMFSQINDIRLDNGLSSLGWVNPRLYGLYDKSDSEYYNDVLEGYNYGCSGDGQDNDVGFYAAKGWDPVTGVGTPKWAKMKKLLVYL